MVNHHLMWKVLVWNALINQFIVYFSYHLWAPHKLLILFNFYHIFFIYSIFSKNLFLNLLDHYLLLPEFSVVDLDQMNEHVVY